MKRKLKRQYARLNPAQLKRRILDLQDALYKTAVFKGAKEKQRYSLAAAATE